MLRRLLSTPVLPALLACAVLIAQTVPAAAGAGRSAALVEALRLGELLEIMREEGLDHGAEIGATLLGARADRAWTAAVERIYAPDRMLGIMERRIDAELGEDPAALDTMIDFFASERGQRVVELEIGARRAMLDSAIDQAARDAWERIADEDPPRADRLRRFADVGDLIEANVVGGLNSTFAFYMGLLDGGDTRMGEGEVLADVWAQEPGIRAEIEEWLFAYLALAYGPLEDADLDVYTAFFETAEGKALNTARFAAFHEMFETLSRDLGRAAGALLEGEEL